MFDMLNIAKAGEQVKEFVEKAALLLDRIEQRQHYIVQQNNEILALLRSQRNVGAVHQPLPNQIQTGEPA